MERRSAQHLLELEKSQLEFEKIRDERSEVVKICEEAISTLKEFHSFHKHLFDYWFNDKY